MYIRTKDGVYKVSSKQKNTYYVLNGRWQFEKQDIINQSENLEELCDRFIFHYQRIIDNEVVDTFHREFWFLWQAKETFDNCKIESKEIKGAIYTDKGLIYVAKMDSEGNLELI